MLRLSCRHPGTSSHPHSPRNFLEKVYRELFAQNDSISNALSYDDSQSDIFWGVEELSCLTSQLLDSRFVIDLDPGGTYRRTAEPQMKRKQDCSRPMRCRPTRRASLLSLTEGDLPVRGALHRVHILI